MITDLDLAPALRTQANYYRAQYFQARVELTKANKGLRRLRRRVDKLRRRLDSLIKTPTRKGTEEDKMSLKEYGKICQNCGKRRESHMYPEQIHGEWVRLCAECWNKRKEK